MLLVAIKPDVVCRIAETESRDLMDEPELLGFHVVVFARNSVFLLTAFELNIAVT